MTASEMLEATKGLDTKTAKMRALRAAGASRSEIAKFLGVTYQRVRNVEKDDERKGGASAARSNPASAAFGESAPQPFSVEPNEIVHFETQPDGSLVVPRAVLAANGFAPAERVTLVPEGDGRIRILSSMESIREAQEIVRRYSTPGVSLVDELFKMRREEFEKEEQEYREMQERSRRK
jgi:hypothetical protein